MPIRLSEPIQTARLTVRVVEASDVDPLFTIHHDRLTTRYIPHMYWPARADAEAWVARGLDRHEKQTAIQCVVERRETRSEPAAVIGTLLLFNVTEDSGLAEIGYLIGASYWRQGYMAEALGAFIECAFSTVGLRRLEAFVDAGNAASNALATRFGFVHEGMLRERWVAAGQTPDTHVFGLLHRDWLAAQQSN